MSSLLPFGIWLLSSAAAAYMDSAIGTQLPALLRVDVSWEIATVNFVRDQMHCWLPNTDSRTVRRKASQYLVTKLSFVTLSFSWLPIAYRRYVHSNRYHTNRKDPEEIGQVFPQFRLLL